MSAPDSGRIVHTLETDYGLHIDRITLHREMIGHVYLVESDGGRQVLKLYRPSLSEEAVRSVGILRYLESRDFPTAPIRPTLHGESHFVLPSPAPDDPSGTGDRIGILFGYVPGDEPRTGGMRIAEIGRHIGRLHRIMADYPGDLPRHGADFYIGRFIRLLDALGYPGNRNAELAAYSAEAWGRLAALPPGFCHGDCHTGNMIRTADGRIVLIDYDAASVATPVVDVATLCDASHFNRFDTAAYDRTQRRLERFVQGYSAERTLSGAELSAVSDFVAVRHCELIATIAAAQGLEEIRTAFLDEQYQWLLDWDRLCRSHRQG